MSAALFVFWRDGGDKFLAVLDSDLLLFAGMLPKVLAGCCIGAFVTLLLPREMVARWVGHESGMTGLAIATAFGFILPGGPLTAYPVAGAFLLVGADADRIVFETNRLLDDHEHYQAMARAHNPFGDGHASERIARIIAQ